MLCLTNRGNPLGIVTLISLLVVKADGISMKGFANFFGGKARDQGRIHAATQKTAKWHVTAQPQSHGILEDSLRVFNSLLKTKTAPLHGIEIPILIQSHALRAHCSRVCWRESEHILSRRFIARDITLDKKTCDGW